jgi:hypothetical protein
VAAIIVLDVFVGIIAALGLIATWNRLRAHPGTAGARGIVVQVDQLAPRRRGLARLQVNLRIAGPVVRYDVGLDLEADGKRFEVSTPKPAARPSMGCDDEEMSWGFEISEDDLDRVWVIASWLDAKGTDLRVAAVARSLTAPDVYEWKWAADWRLSAVGRWRRRRAGTIRARSVPGLGPLDLGRAPVRPRTPQAQLDKVTDVGTAPDDE